MTSRARKTARKVTKSAIRPMPSRGRTERLSERAYRELEELIVTLKLEPGSVHLESELADRLGIGRTPVREALQRLARDRLVRAIPRLGIAISDINVEDQLKLLEVRRDIERFLARSAARRATPMERQRFLECAAEFRQSLAKDDYRLFARADAWLNELVVTASRNEIADDAIQPLRARARRYWYLHFGLSVNADGVRLHCALAEAIAAADAAAAEAASDALMDFIQDYTRQSLPGY